MFLEKCCFKGTFRKYQAEVLQEFDKHIKDKKINVVAAPGSGKTILGLQMICKLNQHVLILAPTITIRNQWKERFISSYVPEGMQIDFISDDVYNLNKFNIVTYQALHYALNKRKIKEESEREEEESNGRVKTEKIDYNLVQELKDKNIKTIVLDEAHHLRAEWWKSLCEVIKGLEDVKVISLTATPPYDVDENEWRKYEEICGTIDAEISVPELVATGDLCPHQDYVIFNMVTNQELSEIKKIRNDIDDFIKALKQNNEFIKMLKLNKILNNWQMNEEIILSDAQYYSSIIIFLNSIGVNIDKRIVKLISDAFIIPKFNKKWAEVLLKNIIYVHKEDYPESEQLIKDLKKQLEILGCVEKRNVYLEEVSAIKKLMASSIGKLESIEQIAEKEYGSLKENLSMVILADYVRYDYLDCNIKDINKIGVVPIFRRIHAKNISNNIAVLTGKLKIVSKSVVPYIKEQLKLININDDNIFSDLTIDNNYVVIEGSKKIENAIVKIVTECVNLKKINILIGTVALLGEGWDAPAVNSLILASYVGSFMLSNQMRGRAIRKSREQNKTANIWHLASLAKLGNNELDMRMDKTQSLTAKKVVNTYSEEELANIIYEYGEERFSRQIAKNICIARKEKEIETTEELVKIIEKSMPAFAKKEGHPAKRTFQAIRIEVNNEIKPLYNTARKCIELLKNEGRLCIITFHSLEDRAVKNAYVDAQGKCTCPKDLPYCVCGAKSEGKIINKKPIIATEEEQEENSRSKSAKLRIFEKIIK